MRKGFPIINAQNPLYLFRGVFLTRKQIQEYIDKVNQLGSIRLWGFISTSKNEGIARGYMDGKAPEGKEAVLYKITWRKPNLHYVMDIGPYKHENEVLIYDGAKFDVTLVEKVTRGNSSYTEIHLSSGY